jgi:hypothetical protein
MTRQAGAGLFDATALSNPAIVSLWGSSYLQGLPVATVSLGRLSGAVPGTGVVNFVLDTVDRGAVDAYTTYAAQPYSVAPYGRGLLTITGSSGSRNFVFYVDGNGGGYVLEPASAVGNFGLMQPQVGAPFATFPTAYYQGGTLFAATTSPISTLPQLLFQNGSIAGNLTGTYAIDPNTGRMLATVSRTLLGGSDLVIYIVSPSNLLIMGDSLNSANSQIASFEVY